MVTNHPIAEAEIRVHFRRREEAVSILIQTLGLDPHEAELTVKKLENRKGIRLHKNTGLTSLLGLVPMLLLAAIGISIALAAGFAVEFFFPSVFSRLEAHFGDVMFIIAACVFIVGLLALMYAWVFVFLHAWFNFLCLLPTEPRNTLECSLPQLMWTQGMESKYFAVRGNYFSSNGA